MKRLTELCPFFALLLGGVGLLLRRWQLATCFDAAGLPISGPATPVLAGFTAAVMVAALVCARCFSGKPDWKSSFGARPMYLLVPPFLGAVAAGTLFVQNYQSEIRESSVVGYAAKALPLLMVLGCALLAVGCLLMARGGKSDPAIIMGPGFGCCFWMIHAYHAHASNPVVPRFAWFLMAIVCSAAAWYYVAGSAMNQNKPRRTLFCALTAVVLCLISLAGEEALCDQLLLLCHAAALTAVSLRLTHTGYEKTE